MKIVILKESLCIGGTERSAANISRALAENHEVYTILFDARDIKYPYGGKLIDLKCPAKKTVVEKVINNIVRQLRYSFLIKKLSPDILFEFISINNPLTRTPRRKRVRIISVRDYLTLEKYTEKFHQCLAVSDALVCNSKRMREVYLDAYPQDRDKVFYVYNVINAAQIGEEARDDVEEAYQTFLSSHRFNIVGVGRFCDVKGFEYLIRVLDLLKRRGCDVGLTLVGDGDYKERYVRLTEELRLGEDVYLTGYQKNPYKYMARCDCFVLSSLIEGFPNVLAEAMSLSLPVVAANCPTGPAEMLRDDADYDAVHDRFAECDYGVLTPPFRDGADNGPQMEEMANAVEMLLNDPEKRSDYAKAAQQRALVFSKEDASKQFDSIFNVLLGRKHGKTF